MRSSLIVDTPGSWNQVGSLNKMTLALSVICQGADPVTIALATLPDQRFRRPGQLVAPEIGRTTPPDPDRHPLRPRTTYRLVLVPRRRHHRRLPTRLHHRLGRRPQDRFPG